MKKLLVYLLSSFLISSCSLLGIQSEESPIYKVLIKDGDFEIREYESYIVAKTTVKGTYKENSGKAFRILAGYIFGKNRSDQDIAMTSPVKVQTKAEKIPMTSPLKAQENLNSEEFQMTFTMPKKYTLGTLPKPLDNRVSFEKIPRKIIASHRFTGFSSQKKKQKVAKELKEWLAKQEDYSISSDYSFAGYNPPWTIPFLKRNEIHFELSKN